jgi:hypothetical protein
MIKLSKKALPDVNLNDIDTTNFIFLSKLF